MNGGRIDHSFNFDYNSKGNGKKKTSNKLSTQSKHYAMDGVMALRKSYLVM